MVLHEPVEPPLVLSSIADPRRWRLLTELSRSDRRVVELTEAVGLPQNLVSYHLRALREAGLVTSRRSSADGRDVYYAADLGRCRRLLIDAMSTFHPGLHLTPAPPELVPGRTGTRRVLFLCTGNSARSQMAEALLAHRSGGAIRACSAGSNPKALHPHAVAVMQARGLDISAAQPKHLRRYRRTRFARVVTLCDKVREICPEFPGPSPAAHWSLPDPSLSDDGLGAFDTVADELERRIEFLIAELAPTPGRTTS